MKTTRPAGTVQFGRIGSTRLLAKPSLLVMGVLLVVLFAPRLDRGGGVDPYLLGVVFVAGLYLSVLVHELAHLAVARAYRMRVPTVTLHLLGGETAIEGSSRTPGQELLTSVVGPLASALLGVASLAAVPLVSDPTAEQLLWLIGWINLLIAAFNMVPGLPLDGGRALRAVIWALTGRESLGVRVAAWVGRLTAVVLVLAVLLWRVGADPRGWIDLAIAALVAWFLWEGASHALRHETRTDTDPRSAP